jgi:hypothetical protein
MAEVYSKLIKKKVLEVQLTAGPPRHLSMQCRRLLSFSSDILALLRNIPSSPERKNTLLDRLLGRYCVIVPSQVSTPGPVHAYALQ